MSTCRRRRVRSARGEEHGGNWKTFLEPAGVRPAGAGSDDRGRVGSHRDGRGAVHARPRRGVSRRAGSGASALGLLGELTRNAPSSSIPLAPRRLVLLLACANVASLTLARTLNRDRELAPSHRAPLRRRRRQLVGQLLTESVMLKPRRRRGAAARRHDTGRVATFIGRFTARAADIGIDGRVLGFTAVVSILTGWHSARCLRSSRAGPASVLRQSGAPARARASHALLRGPCRQVAVWSSFSRQRGCS